MCTGKEIESGLKLVRMETDVATHTCKILSRKNLNIGISILFFCKFLQIKVCPKTWAYFTFRLGWLKTNAGANIGPQNNMYVSPLGFAGEQSTRILRMRFQIVAFSHRSPLN